MTEAGKWLNCGRGGGILTIIIDEIFELFISLSLPSIPILRFLKSLHCHYSAEQSLCSTQEKSRGSTQFLLHTFFFAKLLIKAPDE
jgi:hypothetical protein